MAGKVEIKAVTKSFFGAGRVPVRVLDEIELVLDSGTFTCLVGPSGCGKSTLLRIIDGLLRADSGSVLIDGDPVTGPSLERGFVFQAFNLLPWRTVAANVEFGLENLRVKKAERRKRARVALESVGLEDYADYHPRQLSGGMQQRVGLARALALEPQLLLMDEPFGSLDDQTRMLLQEQLLRVWDETKKTVVFVTHDIEEALYLADRVVVMRSRPGAVTRIIDIPFPRPRTDDLRGNTEMGKLKKEIWAELKGGATLDD